MIIFNWFNARQALFRGDMAYLATDYHILAVRQSLLPTLAANECKEFEEAYMLASVAADLRISQVVDPLMAAKMEISKKYL